MRHEKNPILLVVTMAAFAVGSIGCSITTESILAMEEGSNLTIEITPFPAQVLPLEGGTVMVIDVSIGLLDLLFGKIGGDVEIGELLFTTPPFAFLGIPTLNTEELCVVPVPGDPGGGTFESNLFASTATFDVALNTIALIGNPALAATLPGGGLEFPFALQSTIPLSLGDALGLLTGSGDLSVSQTVDETIQVEISLGGPPTVLDANVTGELNLSGVDAFPTSPLLDDCIAFLNE